MNENINLAEILKDCPENTEFYCSEIDQNVKFMGIEYLDCDGIAFSPGDSYTMVNDNHARYYICVNRYGSIFSKGKTPIIFPSKEQRDWSKFKCPKPKFDPKTLKPFDKVLCRQNTTNWQCNMFSHVVGDWGKINYPFHCFSNIFMYAIPYNDDTKHLVGTADEAPEYYRYWKD